MNASLTTAALLLSSTLSPTAEGRAPQIGTVASTLRGMGKKGDRDELIRPAETTAVEVGEWYNRNKGKIPRERLEATADLKLRLATVDFIPLLRKHGFSDGEIAELFRQARGEEDRARRIRDREKALRGEREKKKK